MKAKSPVIIGLAVMGVCLALTPGRAGPDLNEDVVKKMDQAGIFTPAFKTAVHEYVDTKNKIVTVTQDEKELNDKLPNLKQQAKDAKAKLPALQSELAEYDHTDDSDFATLQKAILDPKGRLEDQIALAQAYVWAYPTSSHLTDAQHDLQQLKQKQADQTQAEKDAEAARVAEHEQLLQRVQARALNLAEWKDFLRDMSQDDLLKYLGRPDAQNVDNWVYSGDWTVDPDTQQKAGLQVYFIAARVSSVVIVNHQ